MTDIEVEELENDPVENSDTEIVERKGLGHPDTICDGIAEAVSKRLCKEYKERFGEILHHNTDEVQLVAGNTSPEFGGGQINKRIYILLAGRATKEFNGETIPVDELAVEAAEEYIRENFKILNPEHIEFESRIGETSTDLKDVFNREKKDLLSNDTSFGVAHYPLSKAEELTLKLEEKVCEIHEAGEDIKIMTLREKEKTDITVAVAGISSRIQNLEEYKEFRNKVKETVKQSSQEYFNQATVHVNVADDIEEGSVYLTETGTSAENGDDGSVGRGNRLNGLITPNRPMTLEAHSGKNPVTHVGKINQHKAEKLAKKIYKETGEFSQIKILTKIGQPIRNPSKIHVETTSDKSEAREIIKSILDSD